MSAYDPQRIDFDLGQRWRRLAGKNHGGSRICVPFPSVNGAPTVNRRDALRLGVSSLVMSAAASATAQTKVDARAAPRMKMTTDIPASITTPDEIQTRIGTLKFFDGFPRQGHRRQSLRQSRFPARRAGVPYCSARCFD